MGVNCEGMVVDTSEAQEELLVERSSAMDANDIRIAIATFASPPLPGRGVRGQTTWGLRGRGLRGRGPPGRPGSVTGHGANLEAKSWSQVQPSLLRKCHYYNNVVRAQDS